MNKLLYNLVDKYLQNSFADEICDIINESNHNEKRIINIFDVGSYLGNFSRSIKNKLREDLRPNFYLFDPNPFLNLEDFDYECLGLSNTETESTYFLNEYFPSSGSGFDRITKDDFLWNLTRKIVTLSPFKSFVQLPATATTLDNICKKKSVFDIELLKIDTEGHEYNVLKGGSEILKKTKIIQIEILSERNQFEQKFSDINYFLEDINFVLHKKKILKTVSFFSNLKAIDAIYLNKSLMK